LGSEILKKNVDLVFAVINHFVLVFFDLREFLGPFKDEIDVLNLFGD
jgi:hypothetical protein